MAFFLSPMRALPSMLAEDVSPALFDEYLEALRAFPEDLPVSADGDVDVTALPSEAIRTRKWGEQRASPSKIEPSHVVALPRALVNMLRTAYEIEEPWVKYTEESVATLSNNGVRKLSGFMGAVWRSDERRHAAVFKAAYLRVTGEPDFIATPHQWEAELHGEAALRRHLFMRLIAELGAGATYAVLAANSKHELSAMMRNVAGDEFRHLAVFWAACKWWLGDALLPRVAQAMRTSAYLAMLHAKERTSYGSMSVQDGLLAMELGAGMGLTMLHLLRWDAKLTRSRLDDVFGSADACRQRRAALPAKVAVEPPAAEMTH